MPGTLSTRRTFDSPSPTKSGDQLSGSSFKFTRPNRNDGPPSVCQRGLNSSIAFDVAVNLFSPEFYSRVRKFSSPTCVPVPEAAVNKHSHPKSREDEVRFSGQVGAVKAESKSVYVQSMSDEEFRLGVGTAYGAHHPRALFGGYLVRHIKPLALGAAIR